MYRVPEGLLPELKREVETVKELGVIEPSHSESSNPVLFCPPQKIVIYSRTWEEHLQHLSQVFVLIKRAGLTLQPKKCSLAQRETKYLSYVIAR